MSGHKEVVGFTLGDEDDSQGLIQMSPSLLGEFSSGAKASRNLLGSQFKIDRSQRTSPTPGQTQEGDKLELGTNRLQRDSRHGGFRDFKTLSEPPVAKTPSERHGLLPPIVQKTPGTFSPQMHSTKAEKQRTGGFGEAANNASRRSFKQSSTRTEVVVVEIKSKKVVQREITSEQSSSSSDAVQPNAIEKIIRGKQKIGSMLSFKKANDKQSVKIGPIIDNEEKNSRGKYHGESHAQSENIEAHQTSESPNQQVAIARNPSNQPESSIIQQKSVSQSKVTQKRGMPAEILRQTTQILGNGALPINDQTHGISEESDNSEDIDIEEFLEISNRYQGRASMGSKAKPYMIYPDDKVRKYWDLLVSLIIIMSCFLTPVYLAFPDLQTDNMQILDQSMNLLFLIDIILSFISARYDSEHQIIDNPCVISKNYLCTWFLVDLSSVIPFELLFSFGSFNKITRFTRLGKLYKLLRMTKIMRVLRISKIKNKEVRNLSEIIKISAATERFIYLIITFTVMQHVVACLWIFVAKMDDDSSKANWIYIKDMVDENDQDVYVTALYFTVTTLVTVGYGDITPQSSQEKIFCMVIMIIGIVTFSYMTGSLSSIIQSIDSNEAHIQEKITVLNNLAQDYDLDVGLFRKLVKNIKYDHSRKQKDMVQFMEELPHKLKVELAFAVHQKMYKQVKFFEQKERSFIAWITKILKPSKIDDQEYAFKEGEDVVEMCFLAKGSIQYVLPRYDNKSFSAVAQGDHFGYLELADDPMFTQNDEVCSTSTAAEKLRANKTILRRFTLMSTGASEVLLLQVADLIKMRLEFPSAINDLFGKIKSEFQALTILKLELIRSQELEKVQTQSALLTQKSLGGQTSKSGESIPILRGVARKKLKSIVRFGVIGGLSKKLKGPQSPTFTKSATMGSDKLTAGISEQAMTPQNPIGKSLFQKRQTQKQPFSQPIHSEGTPIDIDFESKYKQDNSQMDKSFNSDLESYSDVPKQDFNIEQHQSMQLSDQSAAKNIYIESPNFQGRSADNSPAPRLPIVQDDFKSQIITNQNNMGSFSIGGGPMQPRQSIHFKEQIEVLNLEVSKGRCRQEEGDFTTQLKGEVKELKDMMKTLISAVENVKTDVKRVQEQNANLRYQIYRGKHRQSKRR
ncbi:hypothetical protein FGO68_gene14280 [Halteria grandinella]|uniref:Cyclic nucleotide-binding domain-containing protein n=1 Tax=Halteria grandinella TaxID=5974 RepID=A0A8J8P5D0_HALGN|nr:hypothetical protein FGO68_gene14280 [Halteria grandinella]